MVYFCSGLWFTHAARKAFEAGIVIENGWIVEVQECWQNIVETQLANTYGTFFGPEKEKNLELPKPEGRPPDSASERCVTVSHHTAPLKQR